MEEEGPIIFNATAIVRVRETVGSNNKKRRIKRLKNISLRNRGGEGGGSHLPRLRTTNFSDELILLKNTFSSTNRVYASTF